jgi:hypothetical protein
MADTGGGWPKEANLLASGLSLAVKRVRWQGIQRDVLRGPWYNKDLGIYSLAVSYRIFPGIFLWLAVGTV